MWSGKLTGTQKHWALEEFQNHREQTIQATQTTQDANRWFNLYN